MNEIHVVGSIMRQLVCSTQKQLLNVNTKRWGEKKGREPIDLLRPGTEKQIPDTPNRESASPSLGLLCRSTGWRCTKKPTLECHESRCELYSPDLSNLSGMYHRNKSTTSKKEERESRRTRRKRTKGGKRRRRRDAGRTGGKKSLYRVIGWPPPDPPKLIRAEESSMEKSSSRAVADYVDAS